MKHHLGTRRRPRRLLAGAAAVLTALALAACSSNGGNSTANSQKSQGVVHLSLWSWSGATPAPVELWNKTHPNVQIDLTRIPAGNGGGYAKMLTAIKAGNAPDLGQIEYDVLPSFIHTGGLLDLTKYGAGSLEKNYPPVMWGQVAFGGGVYAIPRDAGPLGLYYRDDLFKKYGLAIPSTWSQFASEAEQLHAKDKTVYLSPFFTDDPAWIAALSQQAGSTWFKTSGSTWNVGIDDAATLKVADYWQQLIDKGVVKPEQGASPSFGKDLSDGTLLAYPSAIWGQLNFNSLAPKLAGHWRAAPLPTWEGSAAGAQYGGSSFGVFKDSKHPQEAEQFAKWLGNDTGALTLLTKFGDYPASIPGQSIKQANTGVPYFGGQNIYPIFKAALNSALKGSATWGPTMTTVFTTLSDGLGKAATPGSGVTVPQVFQNVQQSTVSDMKSQGFKVQSSTR